MPNVYQDAVVTKYNIFNSLFLSLPFHDIFRTGTLLPLLVQASEEGFEAGKSPQQIIESFFEEYTEHATEHERRDMLFNFIKFIERQVVLFDSVEDAGFDQTHDLNGPGSITQLLNRVDSDDLREKLLKKLDDFCVRIVLTAHPTQFYPGKVLGIITDLEEAIKDNDFVIWSIKAKTRPMFRMIILNCRKLLKLVLSNWKIFTWPRANLPSVGCAFLGKEKGVYRNQ